MATRRPDLTNRFTLRALARFVALGLCALPTLAYATDSPVESTPQTSSNESAGVHVECTRIDGSTAGGLWAGAPDGRAVDVVTPAGAVKIDVDELMQLSFAKPAEAPSAVWSDPAPDSLVIFHLADGGRLRGRLVQKSGDALIAETPLGNEIAMTLDRLAAVQFSSDESSQRSAELFYKSLAGRLPGRDVLITKGDDDAKDLPGRLEALNPTTGTFYFGDRVRSFNRDRVFGIVFAIGPGAVPDFPVTVELADGSAFSGRFLGSQHGVAEFAASLGSEVRIPVASIVHLRFRSPRVVYLSDIRPVDERTEGRLHRPWSARMDRCVAGGPISLGGKRFAKGLGVHSRTELDYDVSGEFTLFVATIGIDDAASAHGAVVFRVVGDGRSLFESPLMTRAGGPLTCRVDVSGVKLLTLEVDYGDALDLADYADWGGARLLRSGNGSTAGASSHDT